jgi:sensor histidine kinase
MVICCILGASILIGFIVSIIFTRIPVKPLDELIKGMDRLADGDYSVRINFNKNPGLKKVEHGFNKMAEELQNTELLSSSFINDFSHEFKTPLVSILGFTKLLRKNILTGEEREEYLGIIEEEMKRLYTMANGILNLTKVENQSILTNVTEYNLSEQIRLTVLLLESKWTARNINMNIDFGEYTINANEEMMKQVWINLLDNAIKFSPEGEEISIRISKKNEHIYVSISGKGPHIEDEEINKIFRKFYQSDSSHSTEGTGIGLALVSRIIELHKGRIEVNSDKNINTFTVIL